MAEFDPPEARTSPISLAVSSKSLRQGFLYPDAPSGLSGESFAYFGVVLIVRSIFGCGS